MSQSQLGLSVLLGIVIALGLPAFVLPQQSTVGTGGSPGGGGGQSAQLSSVPNTDLNLQETTEDRRREIRYARKVNINTASEEELQSVPKIGPNYAEDIVSFRKQGNTFGSVDDLKKISGFGEKTVNSIRQYIKVGKEYRSSGASGSQTGEKLDINQASLEELKSLPGVGTVTAERIVRYRNQQGEINSRTDLDEIPGIGAGLIEKILPEIKELPGGGAHRGAGTININSAGKSELTQLPGVGSVTAERIIQYRRQQGGFDSVEDLESVSGIGDATIEGLRDQATAR